MWHLRQQRGWWWRWQGRRSRTVARPSDEMDFRWRNNRLPNELHQRLGRRRRHRRHHLPDTAKKAQQKITQQIGVKAFVETSARWKGEKRRVCHFFIRRLSQPRGRSAIIAVGRPPVYQIWYKERKLTQCYSFLLPFPLRLSASCSLSPSLFLPPPLCAHST